MTDAKLVLHALRTAQTRQLAARATRAVRRRRFPAPTRASLQAVEGAWATDAYAVAVELEGDSRLAGFHRHYGGDALAHARRGDESAARSAIEAWISANPPRRGDPWHPYVVSQRVGNWIAAVSLAPEIATEEVASSLALQARYLARNVEDDILGNHVIANARALVLAGRALDERTLLERGERLLRREVPQQVLPDGGHYERSPLYHLLVLRDLLDVRAAAALSFLDAPIERMRRFAAALQRPDGLPAPFNDALLELAPALDLPAAPDGTVVFEDTGYTVVRDGATWLAFDCGPPSPPFLPPHAHADVLSFQLWEDGRPVVVDPGTSTYDAGAVRDAERGTRAHSTVTVDGRDQFRLWAAFRSGPLPRVTRIGPLEGEVRYGGIRHRRRIELEPDAIVLHDEVAGGTDVEVRLPLATRIEIEPDDWDVGTIAERLGTRREIPVAVRRRTGAWRIPRRATL